MTSPTKIAKTHYAAAMAECAATGQGEDAVARAFINLALETYLKSRSIDDVRRELQNLGENLDPDTDYVFMRP